MRILRWSCIPVLPLVLFFFGCGESREVTLYLQDLKVKGPVSEPPVHITKDPEAHSIQITPRVWGIVRRVSTGAIDGHSPISSTGVFRVDTLRNPDGGIYFRDPGGINNIDFTGSNFTWSYPRSGGGLDIDLSLSERWAISFGATYSLVDSKGLWGYRAGLGLRQQKGNLGYRLDVGWQWESLAFESRTLAADRALSQSSSTIVFYRDKGTSTTGNFYASLTLNGANPEWPVNPFIQIGFSRQTLQDYKPTGQQQEVWIVPPFFLIPANQLVTVNDLRGKFESTRIQVTPGAFFELDPTFRLVVGARLSIETGIEDLSEPVLFTPFLQIDWIP